MDTSAQEYRINAATCLRLSKTMDEDNKRRLEEIAQRWLELAEQEEQDERVYLEAAEWRRNRPRPQAIVGTTAHARTLECPSRW